MSYGFNATFSFMASGACGGQVASGEEGIGADAGFSAVPQGLTFTCPSRSWR